MERSGRVLLSLLVVAAGGSSARTAAAAEGARGAGPDPAQVAAAIQRVYPALVRIHVVAVEFRDGREVKQEASGSGVIVSSDGMVVTNHHVAGHARRVSCTLADRREVDAVVVGSDPLADIAVLRLDPSGKPYPSARWGESARLRVGDPVLAMGSPLALSQSVTQGIVSNTQMMLPSMMGPDAFRLDGEAVGSLVRWIGHDAAIFPGNSGGPLVDLSGDVVGVNEISLGLAGAIPAELARAVADELSRRGEVRRSWLGLDVQPLLKGGGTRGALVSGVVQSSPAEKAGIRAGDLLLAYEGAPVTIRYAEEEAGFNGRVLSTPVGARVELTLLRDGKEQKVQAVTVERGPARAEEVALRDWGMSASDLTLLSARERRREPRSGVLVSSVRSGGPVAEAKPPLRPDDVLVSVGGRPVRTVKELAEVSAQLAGGSQGGREAGAPRDVRPVPVLVGFERQAQRFVTVVKVGEREEQDRSPEARKAWLPVDTQVLTADIAEALGVKGRPGVRVTQVFPGSTAEQAGLQVGDVLFRVDGEPIRASQPEDLEVLPAMIRPYRVGARVKLEGWRSGAPLALEAELAASPLSTRELVEYRDRSFEFAVRDLTSFDRLHGSMDRDQAGALVTRVEAGGWAALAHLAVGDVVLAVDGERTPDTAALGARMRRLAAARSPRVVFFVLRGVETLFVELEPAWPAAAGKVGSLGPWEQP
jgi:serine protease Do